MISKDYIIDKSTDYDELAIDVEFLLEEKLDYYVNVHISPAGKFGFSCEVTTAPDEVSLETYSTKIFGGYGEMTLQELVKLLENELP